MANLNALYDLSYPTETNQVGLSSNSSISLVIGIWEMAYLLNWGPGLLL